MPSTPVPGPTPAPARSRTARDMALSIVVLLIPVVVVVAIFRLQGGEDVVVVDPTAAFAQAEAAGAVEVTVPAGLSPAWRPVSAQYLTGESGVTLRVGYLTPTGGAIQLVASNEPYDELVAREFAGRVQPVGTVTLAGRHWQSLRVRGDEPALVNTSPQRTLIVLGRASAGELALLATAVS